MYFLYQLVSPRPRARLSSVRPTSTSERSLAREYHITSLCTTVCSVGHGSGRLCLHRHAPTGYCQRLQQYSTPAKAKTRTGLRRARESGARDQMELETDSNVAFCFAGSPAHLVSLPPSRPHISTPTTATPFNGSLTLRSFRSLVILSSDLI